MKLTRLVIAQLWVFALLAAVSVTYGLLGYVDLSRVTDIGTYRVVAEFPNSGGIYDAALVTYRGVPVGRVVDVEVDLSSATAPVRVGLKLDSDTPVPGAVSAHIKSMSAIGEQFVDLIPLSDGGQLRDGDVLSAADNHSPTPTNDVLEAVHALVADLSAEDLETTIGEVSTAVGPAGEHLARLIDSSQSLLRLAQVDLNPTVRLIRDAEPLLRTGNQVAADLRSSVSDLASFTRQLRMSDGQIRGLLDTVPSAADSVSTTFEELTPTLPTLLADLQTTGQVLRVNIPQIKQILAVYPALTAGVNYSVKDFDLGDSPQAPLDVKLGNSLNPPPCSEGYGNIVRRDPSDLSVAPMPTAQHCKARTDNPKVARGSRNIPCATDPGTRTARVADCPQGAPSTWGSMLSRPGRATTSASNRPASKPVARPRAVPYSDTTGQFTGPDGIAYLVGAAADTSMGKDSMTWQSLLIK